MRSITVLLTLMILLGSTWAQRLTEPTTGLSVAAPVGYNISITEARLPSIAAISIRRPTDREGYDGCQAAFRPVRQNESYSQAELNMATGTDRWRGEIAQSIGSTYLIDYSEPFLHAQSEGILLEGMIRMAQGVPGIYKDLRTLFIILETPRGRTSIVCVSDRQEFDGRRDEFLAISRSTTAPTQASVALRPGTTRF